MDPERGTQEGVDRIHALITDLKMEMGGMCAGLAGVGDHIPLSHGEFSGGTLHVDGVTFQPFLFP